MRAELATLAIPFAGTAHAAAFALAESRRIDSAIPGPPAKNRFLDDADGAFLLPTLPPLRNTATLGLSGAEILDLFGHRGHVPRLADIPTQETS